MTLQQKHFLFREAATRARRAAEGWKEQTNKYGTYLASEGPLSPGASSMAVSYARAANTISGEIFDAILPVRTVEPDIGVLESAEQWIKDCEAGLVTVDLS